MLFEGDRIAADAYLKTIAGRFYVYVLCRPDGRPFYVGKGLNRRVLEHEAEARRNHPVGETNPFKCNVIRKIIRDGGEIIYRIDTIYDPADQQDCLEREAFLIKTHRRLHEGGYLTNLAGGLGNLSGAAPHSLARHADTLSGEPTDNPERAILNRFLQGIGPVGSVPVKPIDQITRILPTTPHPQPRSPTPRCAYALIASASASGQQLVPGAVLPRAFVYQGVDAIIENGVSRDILKAGMASLVAAPDPAGEGYLLSADNIAVLAQLVGQEALVERGLL
jgi:hypothetical protein